MHYISTRDPLSTKISFKSAMLSGMADDGGLYVPESLPKVTHLFSNWQTLSYSDLAFELIKLFITDIPEDTLKTLIKNAYDNFDTSNIVEIHECNHLSILELFHGPTLAFKDIALQFIGQLLQHYIQEDNTHLNVLGATSGDTGSAAIHALKGLKNLNVFMMFPKDSVSSLQEAQMTSVLDENIFCLEIPGTFDDCQSILKHLLNQKDIQKSFNLTAINSINCARILAQMVYYFFSWFQLGKPDQFNIAVPTGNFGNILAGFYAYKMGLPIQQFILASNENDICPRFFQTGVYARGSVKNTIAPAMDIQVASNFERYLFEWFDRDASQVNQFMTEFEQTGRATLSKSKPSELFTAISITDDHILDTIKLYHKEYNYIADPHTATALEALSLYDNSFATPSLCVATAHPSKFPETINQAIAIEPLHHSLEAIKDNEKRKHIIENSSESVLNFIQQNHVR